MPEQDLDCKEERCFFKDCQTEELKQKMSHVCERCIRNKKCDYPEGNYHTPTFESGY